MANNVVTIDPFKVQKAGDDVLTESKKMETALNAIKDYIANTKNFFQSDGGDTTRKNFSESAAKFAEFKKFTDEYGQFLQSYGKAQEKLDDEIASIGAKIPKL